MRYKATNLFLSKAKQSDKIVRKISVLTFALKFTEILGEEDKSEVNMHIHANTRAKYLMSTWYLSFWAVINVLHRDETVM